MQRLYHYTMLNQIHTVVINIIFPRTYLERYLEKCSQIEFISKLTPRIQVQHRQFSPFYYKQQLVKDCIIELKERNNKNVARLFAQTLAQYILQNIQILQKNMVNASYFIVPIPQHISKTKEKGFLHTQTISEEIFKHILHRDSNLNISILSCIQKISHTKRLHELKGKKKRFKTIKYTMQACLTKYDAQHAYFFIIDDIFTTGATFKEARRTLLESGVLQEHIFFISIAH
jgi:predicted amidophosphoribosyltransferase